MKRAMEPIKSEILDLYGQQYHNCLGFGASIKYVGKFSEFLTPTLPPVYETPLMHMFFLSVRTPPPSCIRSRAETNSRQESAPDYVLGLEWFRFWIRLFSLGSLNGAGSRAGVSSNAGVGTKFTLFLLQWLICSYFHHVSCSRRVKPT